MTANATINIKDSLASALTTTLTSNQAYAFVAKFTPWSGNTVPDFVGDDEETVNTWFEMVYGKRIANNEVARLVARNAWANGTAFTAYRQATSPLEATFHTITDERKVYKCVSNAGTVSTSKPTSTSNTTFVTADGYVWKYMFTVSSQGLSKFGDIDLMPIEEDANVTAATVLGTIDAVVVSDSGNNWVAQNSGSVLAKSSNTLFRIADAAQTTNNYYTTSGFYVTAGPGAGYYGRVTSYVSNSSGNYVSLTPSANSVEFGSTYVISPYVAIAGDGSGAVAYAVANSTTARVDSVSVINVGSGYTWANVTLEAGASYSNSNYDVEAIVAPLCGHGGDPALELGSDKVCVSVSLSNTLNVPANVAFATAGILYQPKQYANSLASFTNTEFNQTWTANTALAVGSPAPPASGERFTGQASGATAVVAWANATYLRFGVVKGTFQAGETAVSNVSSSVFTMNVINTPDLAPTKGQVFAGSNFLPVTRTTTSTERVRFVITV